MRDARQQTMTNNRFQGLAPQPIEENTSSNLSPGYLKLFTPYIDQGQYQQNPGIYHHFQEY